MGTINKLKSNFINRNSFNVGFNNRSPLNQYKSTMPTSFEKAIPTLDGAKVGKHISDGAQAMSNAKIKGSKVINQSIMGAAKEIGTAIGKKQAAKKAQEEKEKLEKEKSNNEEAINEEAINEKKRDEVTGQIGDALNLSPNQFENN